VNFEVLREPAAFPQLSEAVSPGTRAPQRPCLHAHCPPVPPRPRPCHAPRWVIAGKGDRVCFISEGNDLGHERSMTYHQVLSEVCRVVSV
jgi:hypothetical protein